MVKNKTYWTDAFLLYVINFVKSKKGSNFTLPTVSGEYVVKLQDGSMYTLEFDSDTLRWWKHNVYYGEHLCVGEGGTDVATLSSWFTHNPDPIYHAKLLLNKLKMHDIVVANRMLMPDRHNQYIVTVTDTSTVKQTSNDKIHPPLNFLFTKTGPKE